jgi:hypothetical protein
MDKRCITVKPCDLKGAEAIHLELKGKAKSTTDVFKG